MRKIDWINIPDLDFCIYDVTFHSATRWANRTVNHKSTPRARHGILYLFSGCAEFVGDDEKVILASVGDVIYIPKGERYLFTYKEETRFALIDFSAISPSGEEIALFDGIEPMIGGSSTPEIVSIFEKVEKICCEEGGTTLFRRKELLYRLLSYFTRSGGFIVPDGRYGKIAAGVQLLHKTYLENVPITELSAESNISVSLFRQLFREYYGTSPIQYRNELRINRATELLAEGDYTVAEVAEMSGFVNESYFCRLYKRTTGKTPSKK
ncbi:MAG: AraC family transcriptional regulator [Clostridia bacterium]|nr:AraC family transcriptional regulator [Clostridia bacterium]